jgi:hypothetical protein
VRPQSAHRIHVEEGGEQLPAGPAIPAPKDLNPLVPENLSNIVMECVRTNPLKRPGDMGELGRRLEAVRHTLRRSAEATHAAA